MRTNQDGLGRSVTISDEEIGLLDGDQTLVQQTELNVSERFSALLWMPHCQHKISKVWENANDGVSVRYHHVGIPYHYLCEPLLKRLGFYQVSQMVGMSVDRFLIGALVERWRPETNTFHLPVGEMTVSLQDVSCLWGLPIQGKPRDWRKLHAEYVNQYNRIWQSMVDEEQHFDQASLPQYRHWFQQYGMYTVFWMLDPLKDINMEAKLSSMLSESGLPLCVDDIRSDDSASPFSTPKPIKPEEINMDVMDNWLYSNRGFTRYLSLGTYSDVLESQDKH
uniref:Aminotransferase-like plant mobile domain-containing protein n=1 Tax=Oryza sativa subsp. japonica TaxID=39947 RepID=Q2R120_ORYSJ|nr:hypothetical protein LOC_Os11g40630 [Oryza sativa Japonica Group]